MSIVVRVENVSKKYQLGKIGTQSLKGDVQRWWARKRGQEDPFAKIGEEDNNRSGDFWALRDVSFDINQGDAIGIIGKNGAGKSTLLKILSRITLPTTGRLRVKGRIASLLEVGTGFNPDLSGRENIFLNGAILGMTKQEVKRKFDEIVDFSGVEKFIDTPVKRYSSGMYVRLAFAVAAHLDSEILILDEVLAVGDAEFQRKCIGKMDDVTRNQGRTVIFVSHGLSSVKSFCNRAILLRKGALVANGAITEVTDMYDSDIYNSSTAYLKFQTVRQWNDGEAPSNNSIALRRIAICDDENNVLNTLDTDTPFNIVLDYEILKNDTVAGMTVVFYDLYDNCIFGSINNHEPHYYGKHLKTGFYRNICRVPGSFFNNGAFRISVIMFNQGFSDPVVVENALRIEIQDGILVRKDFQGAYSGYLRPLLDWQTFELKLNLV